MEQPQQQQQQQQQPNQHLNGPKLSAITTFNTESMEEKLPLYSVFLLILVISAGFLTALFPCRLQNALNDNIYLKHASAFMTMLFFVILTIPDYDKKIFEVIPKTFFLYAFFLILIKTDFPFFISILAIISIIYILVLRRAELRDEITERAKDETKSKGDSSSAASVVDAGAQNEYNLIVNVNNALTVSIIPLLVIGCLVYLGKKRHQYRDKFSLITFIFGTFKCKPNQPKDITITDSLKHVFTSA